MINPIDINLSSLGWSYQYVSIIFKVQAITENNDNAAIWVNARIER
jgi:hypothetical protein